MPSKTTSPSRAETASRIISFVLALIGMFLGYADKVGSAPEFLREYSHLWPMFVTGAVVLKQVLLLAGDFLDDGVKNDSFKL